MVSDLVGALRDPIIVMPGGWGDTLPDWIKTQVTLERLVENMKQAQGQEPTGTDAEATAYLYTACLTAPMTEQWTRIYLYVAGKTCARWGKHELPPDVQVNSLNDYQLDELKRLKRWLYQKLVLARQEREREERREEREQEAEKKKEERPVLFEL